MIDIIDIVEIGHKIQINVFCILSRRRHRKVGKGIERMQIVVAVPLDGRVSSILEPIFGILEIAQLSQDSHLRYVQINLCHLTIMMNERMMRNVHQDFQFQSIQFQ